MTPELQRAVLEAAEQALVDATEAGAIAPGDQVGAVHLGALRGADVALRWLQGQVGRQLDGIY